MAYERDRFGFLVDAPCPHCGVNKYVSPEGEAQGKQPICLNGCDLPHWQYLLMQQGLAEAHARLVEREAGLSPDET